MGREAGKQARWEGCQAGGTCAAGLWLLQGMLGLVVSSMVGEGEAEMAASSSCIV